MPLFLILKKSLVMKKSFKLSQINLKDPVVRHKVSKELQEFEASFEYPLGCEKFKIVHGALPGQDYFSFFEQMGKVHYFLAKDGEKIIGAGCAILRNGEEGKYWYLCDLKVLKEYRNVGVMEKMYKRYMFKCMLKSRKMVTVNMGSGVVRKSGLLKKTQKLLFMFNLKVDVLNFHTWKKKNVPSNLMFITTNNGKKDLIIGNSAMNLYHASEHSMAGFTQCNLDNIPEDADVMTCVNAAIDPYESSTISGKGLLISVGLKNPKIFTNEI